MTDAGRRRSRRVEADAVPTGLDVLGEVAWGTHLTLYFETIADLVATLVPFFRAGLENNEMCVWLPSKPEVREQGLAALRHDVPDLERRIESGQFHLGDSDAWYGPVGPIRARQIVRKWVAVADRAVAAGYAGLRGSGGPELVDRRDRVAFARYEEQLHRMTATRRMVVLCTYQLSRATASDLLTSIRRHDLAMARWEGKWEVIESRALKQTKEQMHRAKLELQRRVEERTIELAEVRRTAAEQALEARYAAALEERTRLAREIHDSLLQGVTGIALQLRAAIPRLRADGSPVAQTIESVVELAESTMRDARRAVWDMRAPSGTKRELAAAVEEAVRSVAGATVVEFTVAGRPRAVRPDVEDTFVRVAQEAALNAVRHAAPRRVGVELAFTMRDVRLTVSDDGSGFRVDDEVPSRAGRWGLLGMRERAERINATLTIVSTIGQGTTIELRWPRRRPTLRR